MLHILYGTNCKYTAQAAHPYETATRCADQNAYCFGLPAPTTGVHICFKQKISSTSYRSQITTLFLILLHLLQLPNANTKDVTTCRYSENCSAGFGLQAPVQHMSKKCISPTP